jgi:MtN3 and saliva related transmembrane protein
MNFITLIGFSAGIFVAFGLVPQIIKVLSTRQTRDISLVWTFIAMMGFVQWIIYAIVTFNMPVLFATGLNFVFMIILFFAKLKYG